MAKKQFLDADGLNELVKHIPQITAGNNVTLVPNKDEPNKITINSDWNQSLFTFATKSEIERLFD